MIETVQTWGLHNAWQVPPPAGKPRPNPQSKHWRRPANGPRPRKHLTSRPHERLRMNMGYACTKGFHW